MSSANLSMKHGLHEAHTNVFPITYNNIYNISYGCMFNHPYALNAFRIGSSLNLSKLPVEVCNPTVINTDRAKHMRIDLLHCKTYDLFPCCPVHTSTQRAKTSAINIWCIWSLLSVCSTSLSFLRSIIDDRRCSAIAFTPLIISLLSRA